MGETIASFREMESRVRDAAGRRRIVLCGSQDEPALAALVRAHRRGVADGVLVGDAERTRELLAAMGEPESNWELVDEPRELRAARTSVRLVADGEADLPMKGGVQSATYLMAIGSPGTGLVDEGGLLNEATVFEAEGRGLLVAGDCAITIAPTLEQKRQIALNLASLAHPLHGDEPIRVAAISVLEKVSPQIPSSVEAAALAEMAWPDGVVVQGPLALDNAVDAEAAAHKGVTGAVAGRADVLLLPAIEAGNVLHKSLHFFAHVLMASVVLGARVPVVMTSRTDEEETKYHSILTAVHAALTDRSTRASGESA
jgi:phosphate butyryltransferase